MQQNTGKKRELGQHGFTLIEVLIAIGIFSIGILGVAVMQTMSVSSNASAWNVTGNTIIGEHGVETLLSVPYTDVNAMTPGLHTPLQDNDGVDNDSDGTVDEAGETGPIVVSYTIDEDTPIVGTKTVTYTVTRTSVFGTKFTTYRQIIPEII